MEDRIEADGLTSDVTELLDYCTAEHRVCPLPVHWDALLKMLPSKSVDGQMVDPPNPLILGGWWGSTDSDKQMRVRDHILWADSEGRLREVDSFVRSLAEEEWHHKDE